MCVPPQNSTEKGFHLSSLGASSMSCTDVPPMATTRTGSGYCSPKTARSGPISRASSSDASCDAARPRAGRHGGERPKA
eukprot:2001351-Prymnesium_polylepis.1